MSRGPCGLSPSAHVSSRKAPLGARSRRRSAAGPAAAGSYFSHAAIAIPKADFVARYRARFGSEPDEYAASAYACAQIILDALRAVAATGPSAAGLREAVRASAVDKTHRYETVIGTVGFDANGDSFSDNDRVYTDGKGNYSCGAGGVGRIIDLGNGKTATLVGALTGGHDTGRNTFRKNDQFFDWSMRIQKDWSFHDRYHLMPSAEIFNIAGQKNLRLPVCGELRGCFDGTFLQVPGDPRHARLGLRLEW